MSDYFYVVTSLNVLLSESDIHAITCNLPDVGCNHRGTQVSLG